MSDNLPGQQQADASATQATTAREPMLKSKFGENWEAADQSYREIVNQRQQLEQKLNEATALLSEVVQGRMSPSQQAEHRKTALDRLAEVGLPPDAMREAVQEVVRAELQPLARGLAARESILSEYPDFAQKEANFQQFLKGDPGIREKYSKMASIDPEMGLEWAIGKFTAHEAANGKAPTTGAQRAQAALPNSMQQPGRTAVQTNEPDAERMKQALEYYRTTGDDRPLMTERMKGLGHPSLSQT